MFRKTALSLCFTLLLSTLTACGSMDFLHPSANESNTESSPQNQEENTKSAMGAPIALPPSFGETPFNTAETPEEPTQDRMPNGLPALKPMKGVNVDTLFSEKIKDTDKRFNRVETAVVDLRKEFDTYKPSIVRLAAVESDIQNLIKELEVLLQETPTPPAPSAPLNTQNKPEERHSQESQEDVAVKALRHAPTNLGPAAALNIDDKGNEDKSSSNPSYMAKKPPTQLTPQIIEEPVMPAVPKPQDSSSSQSVYKVPASSAQNASSTTIPAMRVGEHHDKIRLVIDLTAPSSYAIDLDNDERLILIEIPDASWDTQKRKNFTDSALLDSYSVEPINDGKGTMLILSLKRATQVLTESTLEPDNTSEFHRIYFDLAL